MINREEFTKLAQTRSQAMRATAPSVEKKKLRKQLEKDVADFLAQGRRIKALPGTEFKPRPAVETSEHDYVSPYQTIKLVNWCAAGSYANPRRTALAKLTGISLKRIRSAITPGCKSRLTRGEYKQICAVMSEVERLEHKGKSA